MVNNKMKNNKKINYSKYKSENEEEIRRFISILIIVLILVLGIYLISKVIVNKRDNQISKNEVTSGSINYNKVNVGMIFNRPYDEYYVLVYNTEDVNASLYSSIMTNYIMKSDNPKLYFCDLNNSLNSKYISNTDEGNKDAKTITELSFGKITLLKISDGKISLYLEGLEKIQTELKEV